MNVGDNMTGRLMTLTCLLTVTAAELFAADEAAVNAAIQKGRSYLVSKLDGASGGQKSLAAYALLKSGTDKSDPGIQAAVEAALLAAEEHYSPGMPRFGHEFAYTVPTHLFLLEAVDPEQYKPQIEALAGYLIQHQQGNGSWFYTESESQAPLSEAADTSQAQFALLGLWSAQRAGVEIPTEVWRKAGAWFLGAQREDGGWLYQPFAGSKYQNQEVTLSITLAGTGSLLLVRHIFYPGGKLSDELAEMTVPKKRHGVLERLKDEQEKQRKAAGAVIPAATLDKAIARGTKVITNRFNNKSHFQVYLFYAMERLSALLDSDVIGGHDWYQYASDELILLQTADGSWNDQPSGPVATTALGILCLSRATAKILGKEPQAKKVGGGLLAGARGLPSDLSKLTLKDGQAVERKSKGEVDDLLAELEKTQDVSVAAVQQAILESVNLDEPEKLVGEVDRLKRLAADSRVDVRCTALWAIGRTGEIRLAPLLIKALSDADADVVREASFALTVLSRKPTGLITSGKTTIPVEPLDGLDEDATEEAAQEHLKKWQSQAVPAWQDWYLSVRPYDERDDRVQLRRKK